MALRSERRFISKEAIQSGMLVEFTYKKVSDESIKSYTVLIVDPNKDDYLHGLLISDLSDAELIGLVTKLGSFTYDPDNRAEPITNLQSDAAYDRYLGIKNERRYRTFLRENISSLRQILTGTIT